MFSPFITLSKRGQRVLQTSRVLAGTIVLCLLSALYEILPEKEITANALINTGLA